MNTEDLERMAREADLAEKETYIEWHREYNVIEYIEIDGQEIYNPVYEDEVEDQYWLEDSYRVAERVTW